MYGVEHKVLAILLSLVILVMAMGVRLWAGTFLVPAGLFALAWFAYTFFPLVLLFDAPVNAAAIAYISAAVFVFSLSAAPFRWRAAIRINRRKTPYDARFDSRLMRRTLYLSAALSLAMSTLTMLNNGLTIEMIVFDLLRTSGQFAAMRGTEGMEYGLVGTLSIFFTYLSPVLGGLRIKAARPRWFFVVSMAPCLFTMVTQSSKLVFLVGLCFYLAAALVAKFYAHDLRTPKLALFPKYIGGAVVIFALVLVSFVSRQGNADIEDLGAIAEPLSFALSSYMLGQIYAFSDFFSFTVGMPAATVFKGGTGALGAYTFASLFGTEFPPGMYLESGRHAQVFETNVFTFFRGLIHDFGVIGSLVFLFIFGLIAHAVTCRLLTKRRAWLACVAFVALVVFILMGYLFSVFVARYVFLNATAVFLLLTINTRARRRRRRPVSLTPAEPA